MNDKLTAEEVDAVIESVREAAIARREDAARSSADSKLFADDPEMSAWLDKQAVISNAEAEFFDDLRAKLVLVLPTC